MVNIDKNERLFLSIWIPCSLIIGFGCILMLAGSIKVGGATLVIGILGMAILLTTMTLPKRKKKNSDPD
jgi:hypothetical protein